MVRRVVPIAALVLLSSVIPSAQLPTPWDGIYSLVQSDRGKLQYRQHCSRCHGEDLEGKKASAPPLPPGILPWTVFGWESRGNTPALSGWEFIANWNGMALSDLFERIRISMPQNAPGSLSRQQNADVLAYILDRNGYPAGLQELPQIMATDVKFTSR